MNINAAEVRSAQIRFIFMAHHGKNFPEDNIQLQNNYTAVIKTISYLFILRIKRNIAAHYAVKLNTEHKIHEAHRNHSQS